MSQVLTPEEMTALFEGLREAEDGPGPICCTPLQETAPRGRVFSEPGRIHSFQNLSTWLMELADLRWPHL
jgi:hypothetical protein